MLVLTRRRKERIVIIAGGERIVIEVVEIGRLTRLGFTAGPDVEIDREEVRISKDEGHAARKQKS